MTSALICCARGTASVERRISAAAAERAQHQDGDDREVPVQPEQQPEAQRGAHEAADELDQAGADQMVRMPSASLMMRDTGTPVWVESK